MSEYNGFLMYNNFLSIYKKIEIMTMTLFNNIIKTKDQSKRCKGFTKTGKQCKNKAIPGTDYCYISHHRDMNVICTKRVYNWFINNIISLITVFSTILGIIVFYDSFYDKYASSLSGIIDSTADARIKIISIGGIKVISESLDGVLVADNEEPVLSISINSNLLYVSAKIRGDNGDLIVVIDRNEWKINKNNFFDRNFTDNALEVVDQNGRVTLQVVNFGDIVHFSGIFNTTKNRVVSFVSLDSSSSAIEIGSRRDELTLKIQPIFEYPSDLHLGSCPGLKDLEKIVKSGKSTFHFGGPIDIGQKFLNRGIVKLI